MGEFENEKHNEQREAEAVKFMYDFIINHYPEITDQDQILLDEVIINHLDEVLNYLDREKLLIRDELKGLEPLGKKLALDNDMDELANVIIDEFQEIKKESK